MLDKRQILWLYIALLHLLLALLVYRTGLVPRVLAKIDGTPVENTALYDALLPYHRRMDGSVPDAAIVFIGDSMVQALATSAIADQTVNYGIGADTIAGLRERLPIYRSMATARALVLSIGVNDLWWRDNREIESLYADLLARLPADVPVLANALFPVAEQYDFPPATNARIKALNEAFGQIASEHRNVTFIDYSARFADGDGELAQRYHIGDGLHLNTQGYRLWSDILREHLRQLTTLEIQREAI